MFKGYEGIQDIAHHLVNITARYSGSNYAALNAELSLPTTFPARRDTGVKSETPLSKLVDTVAKVMHGHSLDGREERLLSDHYDLLQLPANLRAFAFDYMNLAKLYVSEKHQDRRAQKFEEVRDNFPDLLELTILPVLKSRLEGSGISAERIQKVLRQNPDIDPVSVLWELSGAASMHMVSKGLHCYAPEAALLAQAVLQPRPRNVDQLFEDNPANQFLDEVLGYDRIDIQDRAKLFPLFSGMEHILTRSSFLFGLNPEIDRERKEIDKRWLEDKAERIYIDNLEVRLVSPVLQPLLHELITNLIGENGSSRTLSLEEAASYGPIKSSVVIGGNAAKIYGEAPPPEFFGMRKTEIAKRAEQEAQINWSDIPDSTRGKLEAGGFHSMEAVFSALIDQNPGQKEIEARQPLTLRAIQGQRGYKLAPYDVHYALTHPEDAKPGHGAIPNELHRKICVLVEPWSDVESFFDLQPQASDDLERLTGARLHAKFMASVSQDSLLRDAVTTEQLATLHGLTAQEFLHFFTNPLSAYTQIASNGEAQYEPAAALVALGVSFEVDEWQTLKSKMEAIQISLREAANKVVKPAVVSGTNHVAGSASNIKVVDPWEKIPRSLINLAQSEGYKNPEMLIEVIADGIRRAQLENDEVSRPRFYDELGRLIRNAMRNPSAGLIVMRGQPAVIKPKTIAHAHITRLLGEGFLIVEPPLERRSIEPSELYKQYARARIVEAVMGNASLAHIVDLSEVRHVMALVNNLATAYEVRSHLDRLIQPTASLNRVVAWLNQDNPDGATYRPTDLVTCPEWRAANKRDPVPTGLRDYVFAEQRAG